MRKLLKFVSENKAVYISLVKNDFHSRYNGSAFGVFWGFVQPLITVLVYWFVFQIGLRSGDRPDGTPFILWLICGIVPWFFFSEAIGVVSNAFIEYAYLVKKVQFRMGLVPMIKIGSSMIVHLIFVIFVTIILNFYGYQANWFYLQLVYYLIAMTFLTIGLGFLLSSITVFFRDMSQIIAIVIQIGFWIIPIVWGSEVLPSKVRLLFQINPIYYIVEGYRDSLLGGIPFWKHPIQTLYFFIISGIVFIMGVKVFRKLKPNFADVL